MLFADSREVVADARHVDTRSTADGNRMRYALHVELTDRQLADLDRMIDQFGIIVGLVDAETIVFGFLAAH